MKSILIAASMLLSFSVMANEYVLVECNLTQSKSHKIIVKRNNKGVTVSQAVEPAGVSFPKNIVSESEINMDFGRYDVIAEIAQELGNVAKVEVYELSAEDSQEKIFSIYQGKSLNPYNIYQNSFLGRVDCK